MEPLIDINQAAAFLAVKPQSLRMWVSKRIIPHYRVGNRLRFKLSDLEKWSKDNANTIS